MSVIQTFPLTSTESKQIFSLNIIRSNYWIKLLASIIIININKCKKTHCIQTFRPTALFFIAGADFNCNIFNIFTYFKWKKGILCGDPLHAIYTGSNCITILFYIIIEIRLHRLFFAVNKSASSTWKGSFVGNRCTSNQNEKAASAHWWRAETIFLTLSLKWPTRTHNYQQPQAVMGRHVRQLDVTYWCRGSPFRLWTLTAGSV